MNLPLRWHDDVPADLASVKRSFGTEAFAEARSLIEDLPGEPLLGDWLERHEGTGLGLRTAQHRSVPVALWSLTR